MQRRGHVSNSLLPPTRRDSYTTTKQKYDTRHPPQKKEEEPWYDLNDDLFIILDGRVSHLAHFQKLYEEGVTQRRVLRSLAYVVVARSSSSWDSENGGGGGPDRYPKNKRHNILVYAEHIVVVASFLASSTTTTAAAANNNNNHHHLKHSVLLTLIACLSPVEAIWQTREYVIQSTLSFITEKTSSSSTTTTTTREEEWEFMDIHTEMDTLCDLRAICVQLCGGAEEEEFEEHAPTINRVATCVTKTGNVAIVLISTGAMLIDTGLEYLVLCVSHQIEQVGEQMKCWIQTEDYPLIVNRDAVVALTYADAVKRVSREMKENATAATQLGWEASTTMLHLLGTKMDEHQLSEKIASSISPEGIEMVQVAGKVAMVTLGATVIVGKATLTTTSALIKKTASVSAEVVEYKYGSSAAQVIQDAGETAGNCVDTVGIITMLHHRVMPKTMAKKAIHQQVTQEVSKVKETLCFLRGNLPHHVKPTTNGIRPDDDDKRIGMYA